MSNAMRLREGLAIFVALSIAAVGMAYAVGSRTSSAADASPFVDCRVVGDAVEVAFRGSSPTTFQIDDPQQRSYVLVDPAAKLNLVGKAFAAEFRMLIASQQGVAADGSRRLVFAKPGRYRLLFQDANTFAGAELRRFSCDVTIEQRASRASVAEFAVDARGDTALFPVGCNYVGGCGAGDKPCCKVSQAGQPCYCSLCCIARTGVADASQPGTCSTEPKTMTAKR